ncbi:MAG: Omp28-related outer membrane protein, partial [Calditrichia bacterium]
PNAIILAYHGASTDPFQVFPGSGILGMLGLSAYPTGVIDRVSGVQSRGSWYSMMNSRLSVPATVDMDLVRTYNPSTREFEATIQFTALQNLSGQYYFKCILVEDGIVWQQNGSLGGPNYVHDWTVRAIMNGASGELLSSGNWNQNDGITKTVDYTVPVPAGAGPDIVPDSCRIVVLVYESGSPLSSNAEIQQAKQWPLIAPDYVASMQALSPDIIGASNQPASYQAVIYNEGLMQDMYYLDLNFSGPAAWGQNYTTVNGTFNAGEMDSLMVDAGDSVIISVRIDPATVNGAGEAVLGFTSKNRPLLQDEVKFRMVTESGINILVVDAGDEDYETAYTSTLDNVFNGTYGVVSRTGLHPANVNLSAFDAVIWTAANTLPAFFPQEVTALQSYLDFGGNLFISGQDIGNDVYAGQSQFAQSFYNNYLHAEFVSNSSNIFLIKGYDGDPISDGMQYIITDYPYTKSPDQIQPYDPDGIAFMKYYNGPKLAGIRSDAGFFKTVYMATGIEQIDDAATRDSLMARTLRWFDVVVGIEDDPQLKPADFALAQNYPNPFNPSTTIRYTLSSGLPQQTSLTVFNALGQVVRTLVNQKQASGAYTVSWDGRDNSGAPAASGIYYYRLRSGGNVQVQKMILMR